MKDTFGEGAVRLGRSLCDYPQGRVETWDREAGIFTIYFLLEEAKRFEDGLQEQKDFLYIQRKYVRTHKVYIPCDTI